MKGKAPTLHCDAVEEEECTEWTIDHYAMSVSAVNGRRITATMRAPFWFTYGHTDLCPRHSSHWRRYVA